MLRYPINKPPESEDGELHPAEAEIARALRAYTFHQFDPDLDTNSEDLLWWVPTETLYRTYVRYRAETSQRRTFCLDEDCEQLTRQQFGVALIRLYPWLAGRRSRRYQDGKKRWGYLGVEGPESVRVHLEAGRPTRDCD